MKLDSLFKINKNPKLKASQILYNADHIGIAAKGLNNGISFIFSDFIHYNDWDDKLIDSLSANNINALDFINHHAETIKEIYGVEFKVNQDDLSLMQSLTETDEDIRAIQDFEIEHLGKSDHFYASYAQFYEYAKSYEKALEYWNINLEGNYEHNQNFFYYRRPIELLYKKMDEPKRAIEYAQQLIINHPDQALFLNYMIGKIASENSIEKEAGLKAIAESIKHYKANRVFDLEQARQIEETLMDE